MNAIQPKVSICVVTFNQYNYIEQCLRSLVSQKVNFDFEIIVGDDASTDGTSDVVRNLSLEFPAIIKPIFHHQNVGAMNNYLSVHRAARGVYVCHVDGDDWVEPGKLQSQVDYLDVNTDCSLVAHRMHVWDGLENVGATPKNSQIIGLANLLRNHPIFLNSSIMYRKVVFNEFFSKDLIFIDFYLYVLASISGGVGFLNEIYGNYRRGVGISQKRHLMPYIQAAIDLAEENNANPEDVKYARCKQYFSYAIASLLAKDNVNFLTFLEKAYGLESKRFILSVTYHLRRQFFLLRIMIIFAKKIKSIYVKLR